MPPIITSPTIHATDWFCPNSKTALFYRYWIPPRPQLIVILVHGAGQNSSRFLELATRLMGSGIGSYAFDLRGFGHSCGPRGHITSFFEYLDDLHDFVQLIRKIHPESSLFLLGHSMGGVIGLRYGQEFDSPIHGLLLSSPALRLKISLPKVGQSLIRSASHYLPSLHIRPTRWSPLLRRIRALRPLTTHGLVDPWDTDRFSARWFSELLHHGQPALIHANRMTCPVLSVYPHDDPVIDPGAVRDLHSRLTTPDHTQILLHHAVHNWVFLVLSQIR